VTVNFTNCTKKRINVTDKYTTDPELVTDIKVGDKRIITTSYFNGRLAVIDEIRDGKLYLKVDTQHVGYLMAKDLDVHTRALTKLEKALK
jgi:transcription antitermination factor NusG